MRKTIWTVFVVSVAACAGNAAAQPLGAGLILGSTLTDAITTIHSETVPNSATLIVGPYVELRLPFGLAVEGDALYYPSLYSDAAGGGSQWQFPILAKYRFLKGPIRPFIEGGPAFSHLTDVKTLPNILHSSNYGITLGGGIELKLLALRIAPQIRYNGWVFTNIKSPADLFESKHSQAIFLVNIGF